MTERYIHRVAKHHQPLDVVFSDMVYRSNIVSVIGQALAVRLPVVLVVVNARDTSDAPWSVSNHARCAEVIDVGCEPAAVVQLEEVAGCFVVAADDDGENGGLRSAAVVLVKVAEVSVPARHGHAVEVELVSDCLQNCKTPSVRSLLRFWEETHLEVSADDEKIEL